MAPLRERSLGVIAGLHPQADADFLLKLTTVVAARSAAEGRSTILLERCAPAWPTDTSAALQLQIFDRVECLAYRGVGAVVLPCFASHGFLQELRANSLLPMPSMLEALSDHVRQDRPTVRRIGILTSDQLRAEFDRCFPAGEFQTLHSGGWNSGEYSPERLRQACADLISRGAQLIIPGLSELIPLVAPFASEGVPVLDPHQIYARYVVSTHMLPATRAFKLGVVGGVGPAATVDFLRKVVRNTPARGDQDHLKILVEQNPQIPDRTAHLLGRGPDPTLALYATCKKLQAGDADLIAIPCNTAHAFVELIQPHLDIPILNMLTVTVNHVRESFPTLQEIGLLATTGTLSSRIYQRALAAQGMRQVVPPPELQSLLMDAIYGPRGIKAGFTSGQCVDGLHDVIDELVSRGVRVIILGCTELPLLLDRPELLTRGGQRVTLVDPTEILAIRCVSLGLTGIPA